MRQPPREAIKLVVALALTVYLIVSLATAHDPVPQWGSRSGSDRVQSLSPTNPPARTTRATNPARPTVKPITGARVEATGCS